jgi:hypothetical protein
MRTADEDERSVELGDLAEEDVHVEGQRLGHAVFMMVVAKS